jgi:predicted lipid-binding transport protein (Tim44 family)
VKSPNLRWGTILGGLAGGATGGLGAKYLTNLSPEYQAGAGGAGALIGALIGRAIQKVQQKQGSVKDAARGDMTRKLVGQASSPLSGLRVAQKETPAYTAGFIKHLLELYPEVLSSRTTQTLADPAAVLAHKVRSLKSQLKAAPAKRNWLENLNLSSMLAS